MNRRDFFKRAPEKLIEFPDDFTIPVDYIVAKP